MTHALITKTYENGAVFTFREDGWFNMTKAAKHFSKRLEHFWDNVSTDEYLLALYGLREIPGIPVNSSPAHRLDRLRAAEVAFVETKRGVAADSGTWAHPKLAVFFARWLDVRFAVWCDSVIEDILRGKAELVVTKPEESARAWALQGGPSRRPPAPAMFLRALEGTCFLPLHGPPHAHHTPPCFARP